MVPVPHPRARMTTGTVVAKQTGCRSHRRTNMPGSLRWVQHIGHLQWPYDRAGPLDQERLLVPRAQT